MGQHRPRHQAPESRLTHAVPAPGHRRPTRHQRPDGFRAARLPGAAPRRLACWDDSRDGTCRFTSRRISARVAFPPVPRDDGCSREATGRFDPASFPGSGTSPGISAVGGGGATRSGAGAITSGGGGTCFRGRFIVRILSTGSLGTSLRLSKVLPGAQRAAVGFTLFPGAAAPHPKAAHRVVEVRTGGLAALIQATTSRTTWPAMSVSRKSRP